MNLELNFFSSIKQNCRDNTEGEHCELCANGFDGDATRGTTTDCENLSGSDSIQTCPVRRSP